MATNPYAHLDDEALEITLKQAKVAELKYWELFRTMEVQRKLIEYEIADRKRLAARTDT